MKCALSLLLLFASPSHYVYALDGVGEANRGSRGLQVEEVQQVQKGVPSDPTDAPTESPVPSPSPSMAPTPNPTGTFPPTQIPSVDPTESPVPSPSPSHMPSKTPSHSPSAFPSVTPTSPPTEFPSLKPSNTPSGSPSVSRSPTAGPTVSQVPSREPSFSPSGIPSDLPSLNPSDSPSMSQEPSSTPTTGAPSGIPSDLPSLVPSVSPSSHAPSIAPSSLPSSKPSIHSNTMSAILGVTLDLHDNLGPEHRKIFEHQSIEFIEQQLATDMPTMEGVTIDIISLKIMEQTVIPARRTLSSGRQLHAAGLRIRFNVTGQVLPGEPPDGFVFGNEVGRPFRENYPMFIYRLHSVHEVFANLVNQGRDNDVDAVEVTRTSADAGGLGAGITAGIIIASIGSVVLAMFAGTYAIKSKKADDDSFVGKPMINIYQLDQVDSHSTMMTPYNEATPLSPGSLESGRGAESFKKENHNCLLDDMISKNASDEQDARDYDSDLGLKLSGAVLGAHASKNVLGQSNKSNLSRASDPPGGLHQNEQAPLTKGNLQGLGSLCYSDEEHSLSGSTPTSINLTPNSVQSSPHASSIFSGVGNLGARPMETSEQQHFLQDKEDGSVTSLSLLSPPTPSAKRTGLYDVFAPSGPLGIVVDTTRDGPVVHSMKATSPLLGLVTPGDLIVGLDDMDTRSMTAATLTRLMAKRSHQAERKITLLAIEGASTTAH